MIVAFVAVKLPLPFNVVPLQMNRQIVGPTERLVAVDARVLALAVHTVQVLGQQASAPKYGATEVTNEWLRALVDAPMILQYLFRGEHLVTHVARPLRRLSVRTPGVQPQRVLAQKHSVAFRARQFRISHRLWPITLLEVLIQLESGLEHPVATGTRDCRLWIAFVIDHLGRRMGCTEVPLTRDL